MRLDGGTGNKVEQWEKAEEKAAVVKAKDDQGTSWSVLPSSEGSDGVNLSATPIKGSTRPSYGLSDLCPTCPTCDASPGSCGSSSP